MKTIKIFLIVFFNLLSVSAQDFKSDHFTIQKLSEGVFAAIHKTGGYAICNAGIVNLGDQTLVFDCFISSTAAADLKKAAEELTGNKVNYLVNSHFHNDHIRGNQVFSEAEIISTERTRNLIAEVEPEELKWEAEVVNDRIDTTLKRIAEETDPAKLEEHKMWLGYYKAIKESFLDYNITLPNKLLKDTLLIHGTERNILLFTKGKGHTESDIVLWLPIEKILFAGDLLFVDCHPWLGDGFMNEWMNYLKDLRKLGAAFIVPGHGVIGTNNEIDRMINYIQTINGFVEDAVIQNLTEEQLKLTEIPKAYETWWFSRFFIPNLVISYQKKIGKYH
ncbi:MAG: MBL fold metallo-hydrolase [Ignavibacteriaceae bacterium]|nr:MBL fold metallo-hydrolase [Ignavibacteriaceae bacterium]